MTISVKNDAMKTKLVIRTSSSQITPHKNCLNHDKCDLRRAHCLNPCTEVPFSFSIISWEISKSFRRNVLELPFAASRRVSTFLISSERSSDEHVSQPRSFNNRVNNSLQMSADRQSLDGKCEEENAIRNLLEFNIFLRWTTDSIYGSNVILQQEKSYLWYHKVS